MKMSEMTGEDLVRAFEATCKSLDADKIAVNSLRSEILRRLQNDELMYGEDVARRLSVGLGRPECMARQGKLPHVILPDGSIRFVWREIKPLLRYVPATVRQEMQCENTEN